MLEAIENGFFYEGRFFEFSDVTSLRMYAERIKHSTNFVKTHDSLHSTLDIYFSDNSLGKGGELNLGANKGFFADLRDYETQKRLTDSLLSFYAIISRSTFESRMKRYFDSGDEIVAFRYGKYTFFKDGEISKAGTLFCRMDGSEYDIDLSYTHLLFVKKGSVGKILAELFGSKSIEVLTDKDVLLSLLSHFYGCKW
jgi:hypothetical protein